MMILFVHNLCYMYVQPDIQHLLRQVGQTLPGLFQDDTRGRHCSDDNVPGGLQCLPLSSAVLRKVRQSQQAVLVDAVRPDGNVVEAAIVCAALAGTNVGMQFKWVLRHSHIFVARIVHPLVIVPALDIVHPHGIVAHWCCRAVKGPPPIATVQGACQDALRESSETLTTGLCAQACQASLAGSLQGVLGCASVTGRQDWMWVSSSSQNQLKEGRTVHQANVLPVQWVARTPIVLSVVVGHHQLLQPRGIMSQVLPCQRFQGRTAYTQGKLKAAGDERSFLVRPDPSAHGIVWLVSEANVHVRTLCFSDCASSSLSGP